MDPLTAIAAAPVAAQLALEAVDRTVAATNAVGGAFDKLLSAAIDASLEGPSARELQSPADERTGLRRDSPQVFRYLFAALTGRQPAQLGEALSPGEIRQHAAAVLERLRHRIHHRLTEAGITADEPILLKINSRTVRVEGEPTFGPALATILQNDPQLEREIRYVAALRELVAAADEHAAFADVYARDPRRALDDFHHLAHDYEPRPLLLTL